MWKLLSKIKDSLQRLALATIKPSSMQRAREWPEALLSVAILIVLVLLFTACTTTPKPSCEMPPPSLLPALTEPLPSESYSTSWRKLVESLRGRLTATSATSKQ